MARSYGDTRRVLLVDPNPVKQALRATVLRNYDLEVHVASGFNDAGSMWNSHIYDLILLASQENPAAALLLSQQIKDRKPHQRVALLVGAPAYIQEFGGLLPAIKEHRLPPRGFNPNVIDSISPPQWQAMVQRLVSRRA